MVHFHQQCILIQRLHKFVCEREVDIIHVHTAQCIMLYTCTSVYVCMYIAKWKRYAYVYRGNAYIIRLSLQQHKKNIFDISTFSNQVCFGANNGTFLVTTITPQTAHFFHSPAITSTKGILIYEIKLSANYVTFWSEGTSLL